MTYTNITADMTIGAWYILGPGVGSYRLDVSSIDSKDKEIKQIPYFRCRCSCGHIQDVRGDLLANGISTSCGSCFCKEIYDNITHIFTDHDVNFKEQYKLSPSINSFDFAIFDDNNILLGVFDIQVPAYSERIGNEPKDRVRKRRTILQNKQEFCENNELPYFIIYSNNSDYKDATTNNNSWNTLKNQINTAFSIDDSITHWYD